MTQSRRERAGARRKAQGTREESGSPTSEPEFVLVGILRRPHGLRGEAHVTIETDFPERLQPGVKLYMGNEHSPVTIRSRRPVDGGLLLAFEEFPDRNSMEHIRNAPLFTPISESPPLPPGRYYRHQLVGLSMVTEQGEELGTLAQVLETGANDVYLVRSPQYGEVLLPAISDVVLDVDLEQKVIKVHLLPGLLPDIKAD